MGFKVKAMVHSLKDIAEVEIISENDANDVTAVYNDKICTAIWNIFTSLYYVDDIHGVIGVHNPDIA